MNEAVNLALSDWEPYGRECVLRYSDDRRAPVFSHDKLILEMASSVDIAEWLASAIDALVERELLSRKKTRGLFSNMEEIVVDSDIVREEYYQCSVCKAYVYLSQITCSCTTNVVCTAHVAELCECDVSTRGYRHRYSDQYLGSLYQLQREHETPGIEITT
jgi:[histone H3]-trimethyl-L-lysine4 demethylase